MPNDYYNVSGAPSTGSTGSSATMRGEFSSVAAGFDKMPALSGNNNLLISVNAGATALEAISAATARSRLGLVIGTNVQAWDADLDAIAALASAADKLPYATGAQAWSLTTFTAAARSLLDDATAGDMRTTLGVAIGSDVQAYDDDLAAIAALSSAGMVARTGAGTAAARTLTAGSAKITITNGDGAAGNPTIDAAAASDTQAGAIEIAVQSEMEAGSSNARAVTPGRQHFHPSAAKAWVSCDNDGVAESSYNVSSVTDTGAGVATANFTTAMSSALYCAVVSTSGGGGGIFGGCASRSTGSFQLNSWNTATQAAQDSGRNFGAVFGDI